MITLFKKYKNIGDNQGDFRIWCDSDNFPDDVFSRENCQVNLKDATVDINGTTYHLPFENLSSEWINKSGYKIKLYPYPVCNDKNKTYGFNPSGSIENTWLKVYSKAIEGRGDFIKAAILYSYDSNNNVREFYRIETDYVDKILNERNGLIKIAEDGTIVLNSELTGGAYDDLINQLLGKVQTKIQGLLEVRINQDYGTFSIHKQNGEMIENASFLYKKDENALSRPIHSFEKTEDGGVAVYKNTTGIKFIDSITRTVNGQEVVVPLENANLIVQDKYYELRSVDNIWLKEYSKSKYFVEKYDNGIMESSLINSDGRKVPFVAYDGLGNKLK